MEYNTLDIDLRGKATRDGYEGCMFAYSVVVTAAIVAAVTFVVETVKLESQLLRTLGGAGGLWHMS